jgi:hypothetical protein
MEGNLMTLKRISFGGNLRILETSQFKRPGGPSFSIRGDGMKKVLGRDGYAVVREVFSAKEIARMRDEVTTFLGSNSRPRNGGLCHGPVREDCESTAQ